MRSALRRNPTGTGCWNIPNTPARLNGTVEQILLSGDHGKVAAWRKKQSYKRTMERRPDLFAKFDKSQLTSKADKKILAEAEAEFVAEHPDCAAERAES